MSIAFARRLLLPLLVFSSFGATVCAAESGENLTDDIRFSRDLARYRFFDLAVEWLAQIEKQSGLDEDNRIEVSLAKATISRLASENALTTDERKRYYDEAITHYQEAIEGMGKVMTSRKGESIVDGLSSVLLSKGQFYTDLIEQMKANEADAEVIKAARASAEEAYREVVKTLNTGYADLQQAALDTGSNRLTDLAMFALYRKGESYYRWALLYEPQDFNREDYLVKCGESLLDYIWEAGEETIWVLWAYYYQGMAEYERGFVSPENAAKHDETALASLTHIFSDFGVDFEQLPTLADDARDFVLGLAEQSFRGVAMIYRNAASRIEASQTISDTDDITSMAQGYQVVGDKTWQIKGPVFKPALVAALRRGSIAMIEELEQRMAKHRLKPTPEGYRALLEKSRTLVDLGRGPEALEIVRNVAEKNERNLVGLEAQRLLGNLLDSTDEGSQPPSVLRLAMDGLLSEERWRDAVAIGHQLVNACESDEDKATYLTTAWKDIGGCYQVLSRFLEAAVAYEAGYEAARTINDEDARGELALEAYNAWDRRYRETKQDFDQRERNRVRDVVTRLGASSDIQFMVARESYSNATGEPDADKKKALYATAAVDLAKVDDTSNYYERALVLKARSEEGAGKPEDAIKTFDRLFERAGDVGVAHSKKMTQQREIALAEAAFYKAGVLLDLGRFQDVLDALEGYESKHEKQAPFFANVAYYRIRAQIGLNQWDRAEQLLGSLEANYPKASTVGYAINAVAAGFYDAYRAHAEPDSEEALGLLRKAADYLSRYNKSSGYGSFTNVRNVADWYKKIGELNLAEESYKRLIDRFGKQPKYASTIDSKVKQDYAEVLLAQRNFQDAIPLWTEVYAANRKNRTVVRSYALCLGGWLEEEENRGLYTYTEIPGAGQYREAMDMWVELKKGLEDAGEKSTPGWWETVANYLYCNHMAAKQNPQLKAAGLKLIANYKALHPDLGGGLYKRTIDKLERSFQR